MAEPTASGIGPPGERASYLLAGAALSEPQHIRRRDVLAILLRSRSFLASGWSPTNAVPAGAPDDSWTIVAAVEAAALTHNLRPAAQAAFFALTAAARRPGCSLVLVESLLSTPDEVLALVDLAIADVAVRPDGIWDDGWQEWGEAREIVLNVFEQRARVVAALDHAMSRVRRRWLPGAGDGFRSLSSGASHGAGPNPRAAGWTIGAALAAGCLHATDGALVASNRVHLALVTEMIEPLQEYGGDYPEPESVEGALLWLRSEGDSARSRWVLPDAQRCAAALEALQLTMMEWARGATFTAAVSLTGGPAGEDARYAIAVAIGSGARTPVPGGDLAYALIGEPLADIVNHAELLPVTDHAVRWAWLGRARGLVTQAWPSGSADFRPLGR